MALGSAQPQAAWSVYLAITLCAFALLLVLGTLNFSMASATDATGHAVGSKVMGNDLVTVGDARHIDGDCSHDHESTECSPCSSCSAGLPTTTGPNSDVKIIVRVPILQSHYDRLVPGGIRRPPRLS